MSATLQPHLWGAVTHLRLKIDIMHYADPRHVDWGDMANGMPRLRHLELANMRLACRRRAVFGELTHMTLHHVRIEDCAALRECCARVTHMEVNCGDVEMGDTSDLTVLLDFAPQLVDMRWGTLGHIEHCVNDVARVLARCSTTALQVLCINANVDWAVLRMLSSMPTRMRLLEICEYTEDAPATPGQHRPPPPPPHRGVVPPGAGGCDTLCINYASANTISTVLDYLRPTTCVRINKELAWQAQDDEGCLAAACRALAPYSMRSLRLCTYQRTPPPLRVLQPLGHSLAHLTVVFDGDHDDTAVTHDTVQELRSSLPNLQTLTLCMDSVSNTYSVTPAFWMEMTVQCPPCLTTIRLDKFGVRTMSSYMALQAFLGAFSRQTGRHICMLLAHSSDSECYDELEPAPLDYVHELSYNFGHNVRSVDFVPVSRVCSEYSR